jgi:galactoside O-acetyltransferase
MCDYYTNVELVEMGFAGIGIGVKVFRKSIIVNPRNVWLGNGCQIDDLVFILANEVRIGNRVHIPAMTSIGGGGIIIFEDYSGCSNGCRFLTGNEQFLGECMTGACVPSPYRTPVRSKIVIGKHAGVGANAVIFPGVNIGEGCIVGAGSVVRHDTEPWSVYVGAPARKIKNRPRNKILELEKQLIEEYGY